MVSKSPSFPRSDHDDRGLCQPYFHIMLGIRINQIRSKMLCIIWGLQICRVAFYLVVLPFHRAMLVHVLNFFIRITWGRSRNVTAFRNSANKYKLQQSSYPTWHRAPDYHPSNSLFSLPCSNLGIWILVDKWIFSVNNTHSGSSTTKPTASQLVIFSLREMVLYEKYPWIRRLRLNMAQTAGATEPLAWSDGPRLDHRVYFPI